MIHFDIAVGASGLFDVLYAVMCLQWDVFVSWVFSLVWVFAAYLSTFGYQNPGDHCVLTLCVYSMCCPSVPRLHEWFNMLRYVVFPTVSDIKISATHFAKGVDVVYMASRQEIKFFRPAVVKSTAQLGCRLPGWGHKWFEMCVLCRLCEVMHFIQDLATVQPWNKISMWLFI